jgi:hypothetical protein
MVSQDPALFTKNDRASINRAGKENDRREIKVK